MSSIAETKRRSKKTTRLGPVRVIRPEQYAAFDVNSRFCQLNGMRLKWSRVAESCRHTSCTHDVLPNLKRLST